MRAVAVVPAERALRLVEHPPPRIERPGEVLLQMIEVGVCGTDREIARFDYGTPPPGSPYLVLGHESLARVVEIGPGVTTVRPGDLAVIMVRRPCPHPECRACTRGRPDFCITGDFTERGITGLHGFMTELVVDEEHYLHTVPAHLAAVGVLVEPLTIAEKGLRQVRDVQDRMPWTVSGTPTGEGYGQRAVVLGAGPVGLLGCLALRVRGYETWVYSREPAGSARAEWVELVGARYLSSADVGISDLTERIGRVDLFYEATGAATLSFTALEELGTNGVFVFTGVPGRKGPIQVNGDLIMRRLVLQNQLVFGTVNAGHEAFKAAIVDLAQFQERWPGALEALISRHPPEEFGPLLTGPRTGIKPVIRFHDAV